MSIKFFVFSETPAPVNIVSIILTTSAAKYSSEAACCLTTIPAKKNKDNSTCHKNIYPIKSYLNLRFFIFFFHFKFILALILFPIFIEIVPDIYENLQKWMGWLLLAVVAYMIIVEKSLNGKFWAFAVFSLSGILGLIVLTMPNLEQPLFPMLSGLFGLSMLVVSLSKKVEIPKQRITEESVHVGKMQTIKSLISATFSGSIVSFFPGTYALVFHS